MRVPACKVIALGEITPWGKQFLGAMQNANIVELNVEPSVTRFCESKSNSEVKIAFIENVIESRQWISKIRETRHRVYIVWFGRNFTREDLAFANETRVYQLFENLRPDDKKVLDTLVRLAGQVEHIAEYEQIARSLKAILLQAEPELSKPLLTEIKIAIGKLEKHALHNEMMSMAATEEDSEVKLPFHKTQDLADALQTVQDLERTGVLWVRGNVAGEDGKVEFLQGKIVGSVSGEVRGQKALFRMFLWDEPRFMFTRRDPDSFTMDDELNVTLKFILTEGLALKARYDKIRRELPPFDLKLELEPNALHSGTALPTNYFTTLANVVEYGKVGKILDYSPLPDVMIYEALIRLRKENMIRVSTS
jgi:hypothetical protein